MTVSKFLEADMRSKMRDGQMIRIIGFQYCGRHKKVIRSSINIVMLVHGPAIVIAQQGYTVWVLASKDVENFAVCKVRSFEFIEREESVTEKDN